jgi:hypothetical protein
MNAYVSHPLTPAPIPLTSFAEPRHYTISLHSSDLLSLYSRDHPHGGGRGKSKGNRHPSSPWGWNTKGKRTRKPGSRGHKTGNKFVIRERPRGKNKIALLVK